MKIYVAARFHEKERVKKIYAELKKLGHEITEDWTICTTQQPFSKHQDQAQMCALHTIQGVKDSEVFIYLTNQEIGAGSSVELGAALLSHSVFKSPRIYVVGPHIDTNYCFYHPAVQMRKDLEEVFAELGTYRNRSECEKVL